MFTAQRLQKVIGELCFFKKKRLNMRKQFSGFDDALLMESGGMPPEYITEEALNEGIANGTILPPGGYPSQ